VAKHKNQHYVPRCHFKPFSLNGEGHAVNLFNIPKSFAIQNAPVKGQCAKDYLYGADLRLEDALGQIEACYGRIVHPLSTQTSITPNDLAFLGSFAYLQSHRTDRAIQRKREADLDIQNALYADTPQDPPDIDLTDRALVHESIDSFNATRHFVDDLKCCVVRNKTARDFVTSDDPAIVTNKFYMQKLDRSDFGMASSGTMLVLPLTPRFLLLCYDGGVYTIPEKIGRCVEITDLTDVIALNELQYLKAAENIYFSQWSERDQIAAEFESVRARRPASWSVVHMAVPVDGDPTLFRRVSREEARASQHALLHHQTIFPRPSLWLSKLKFRNPPRTFSNGSGVGHVRKREFLYA
jgi:hypothetical protein